MDVVWSLVLEEGRGGFMDSSKYRQIMTDMFFRGVMPEPEPEDDTPTPAPAASKRAGSKRPAPKRQAPKRPTPLPRSTKQSKLDELRAFNQAIAARAQPAE